MWSELIAVTHTQCYARVRVIIYSLSLPSCRSYFRAIETYIMFETDLADFLANVRASYDIWLREGGVAKLTTASVQGTLSGAITEVGT